MRAIPHGRKASAAKSSVSLRCDCAIRVMKLSARIFRLLVLEEQLDACVNQRNLRTRTSPSGSDQQRNSGDDENRAHQDCAQYAPEQHLALQFGWNSEVAEDEQKDK